MSCNYLNTTKQKERDIMVKHVLADGREVESVEGILIPPSGPTAAVYRIIAEFAKNHPECAHKREGGRDETA